MILGKILLKVTLQPKTVVVVLQKVVAAAAAAQLQASKEADVTKERPTKIEATKAGFTTLSLTTITTATTVVTWLTAKHHGYN